MGFDRYVRVWGPFKYKGFNLKTGRVEWLVEPLDFTVIIDSRTKRVSQAGSPLCRDWVGKHWSALARGVEARHRWGHRPVGEYVACYRCLEKDRVRESCYCKAQRFVDEDRRRAARVESRDG